MWFHIKTKKNCKGGDAVSKLGISFWLGGDTEEDILKILKNKHNLTKEDLEWIRKEKPSWEK
tara:strand:+ start:426 stop:611 length:186 start_codon:yes stop_codon:yes gene_type:complete